MKEMKIIEIPQTWEELTSGQFKYLLKSIFRMMSEKTVSKEDVLYDWADFILGRRKNIYPAQREKYLLSVHDLAKQPEWVFLQEENTITVNFNTTENLLPTLGKLLGPQSHGSDLRFAEYRSAVEFYNRYTKDHNPDDLNALVGILYRKPCRKTSDAAFDGNYREPFNRYLIGKYARRVKNFPEYLKWGVYLWFAHFCRYLLEGTFIIEGNEVCFSPIFERTKSDPDEKKVNSIGMTAVLFSLAESGTFGTAKETDETELFRVLLKLLHDRNMLEDLKKKTK
jgi:hypothetical protein